MKLSIPLKIHSYGLQFLYGLFILIMVGLFTSTYFVTDQRIDYILSLSFFATFILFGFLIGVKEYTTVSKSYLSIQIDKIRYFRSSLLFGLLHTLFYLVLVILYFLLDISSFSFTIISQNPYYIPGSFFFLYLIYLIGNLYGIVLSQSKLFHWLFVVFLVVTAVIITLTYQQIIEFFTLALENFLSNERYLTVYSGLVSLAMGGFLILLNYLFFKKHI